MKAAIRTWSTPVVEEDRRFENCPICGGSLFRKSLDCGEYSFSRCASCGLLRQQPLPEERAIEIRYGEGHGQDYVEYELANEGPFLTLQLMALSDVGFVDPRVGGSQRHSDPRFLDVGCATGALLQKMRDQGWTVSGIELCAQSARWAREKRGLEVFEGSAEHAPWEPESFDAVHASHLIEHLRNPRDFIRKARELLVPEGYLYVATPNVDGFQARLFGSRWRSAIFDHLTLFSARTLKMLLQAEGFVIEKTATWGGLAAGTAPLPLTHVADKAAKRFGFGDVMMIRARKG